MNEDASSKAWTYAEWTPARLMQVKEIAPDYPAITLILNLTSAGKKVTAEEVRQMLNLSQGQLTSQLGSFTRRIIKEIAPEWVTQSPRPGTHEPTAESTPGWHWPFAWERPTAGGSLIYYMPGQVQTIWLSLEGA